MSAAVWAVVVAAGEGTRFGGHKQFAVLGEQSVLHLAVSSVLSSVDGVVVVLPADLASSHEPHEAWSELAEIRQATGRSTRAGSVRAGLELVPDDCEIVVVHDAARPLSSAKLCAAVVAAVRDGADGAVPVLAITDTVKRVSGDRVVETLERTSLVRVQTPQAFVCEMLRRAHEGEPEATDDAGLVEALGGKVVVVEGEATNLKITEPEDLELASWLHAQGAPVGPSLQ